MEFDVIMHENTIEVDIATLNSDNNQTPLITIEECDQNIDTNLEEIVSRSEQNICSEVEMNAEYDHAYCTKKFEVNESLIKENGLLKKEIETLKLKFAKQDESLQEKECEISSLKIKSSVKENLLSSVKKTLSSNQLAVISSSKRVNWSEDEYSKAFGIRYLTREVFQV